MRNTVGYLMLLNLGCVCCRVNVTPKNLAVIVGERMSFECRTDDGTIVREWIFEHPSEKSKTMKIFSNWSSKSWKIEGSIYGVDVDQFGSGIIFSNSTRSENAGTYVCAVDVGDEILMYRAQLIVLESTPICESKLHETSYHISLHCGVLFAGAWVPQMEWRQHDRDATFEDGILVTTGVENFSSTGQVISRVNAVVYSTTSYLSCKIFFSRQSGNTSKTSADNVPDFVYIWKSPAIRSTTQLSSDVGGNTTEIYRVNNLITSRFEVRSEFQNWYTTSLFLVVILTVVCLIFVTLIVIYFVKKRKRTRGKIVNRLHDGAIEADEDLTTVNDYEVIPYACSREFDPDEREFLGEASRAQSLQEQDPNQVVASVSARNSVRTELPLSPDTSDDIFVMGNPPLEYGSHQYDIVNKNGQSDANDMKGDYDRQISYRKTVEKESLEEIPSAYLTIYDFETIVKHPTSLSMETEEKIDKPASEFVEKMQTPDS